MVNERYDEDEADDVRVEEAYVRLKVILTYIKVG